MATKITIGGDSSAAEAALERIIVEFEKANTSSQKFATGANQASAALNRVETEALQASTALGTYQKASLSAATRQQFFSNTLASSGSRIAQTTTKLSSLGSAFGFTEAAAFSSAAQFGTVGVAIGAVGYAADKTNTLLKDLGQTTRGIGDDWESGLFGNLQRLSRDALIATKLFGETTEALGVSGTKVIGITEEGRKEIEERTKREQEAAEQAKQAARDREAEERHLIALREREQREKRQAYLEELQHAKDVADENLRIHQQALQHAEERRQIAEQEKQAEVDKRAEQFAPGGAAEGLPGQIVESVSQRQIAKRIAEQRTAGFRAASEQRVSLLRQEAGDDPFAQKDARVLIKDEQRQQRLRERQAQKDVRRELAQSRKRQERGDFTAADESLGKEQASALQSLATESAKQVTSRAGADQATEAALTQTIAAMTQEQQANAAMEGRMKVLERQAAVIFGNGRRRAQASGR